MAQKKRFPEGLGRVLKRFKKRINLINYIMQTYDKFNIVIYKNDAPFFAYNNIACDERDNEKIQVDLALFNYISRSSLKENVLAVETSSSLIVHGIKTSKNSSKESFIFDFYLLKNKNGIKVSKLKENLDEIMDDFFGIFGDSIFSVERDREKIGIFNNYLKNNELKNSE